MSLIGSRNKQYLSRHDQQSRSIRLRRPFLKFINFLWTLGIIIVLGVLACLSWPFIAKWLEALGSEI